MSTDPTTRDPADAVADEAALRKALASTPRPPRASALSAALTFGWRGMLKVKHVPEQLLDVTITPVMFVLMFTYLFGGAIAGSTGEYLDYILPGILVMSVLFTTVYSGVALNTDLTKGVVDRFRSLPIWRPAPLVGVAARRQRPLPGRGHRDHRARRDRSASGPTPASPGVVAALALVIVFAFGLSWVFTTLGLLLRSPNAVMNAGFMGIFPLTFLSNVFVEPETLPSGARGVRQRQPDLDPGDGSRGLMEGNAAAGDDRDRAGDGRRAHRGLRAADDAPVPHAQLSSAARRPGRAGARAGWGSCGHHPGCGPARRHRCGPRATPLIRAATSGGP